MTQHFWITNLRTGTLTECDAPMDAPVPYTFDTDGAEYEIVAAVIDADGHEVPGSRHSISAVTSF